MKKSIIAAASLFATVACTAWGQGGTIYIRTDMPYSDVKNVDKAILAECQLPHQGAELLEKAVRKAGYTVVRDDAAVKAGKGRVLYVEISSAVSMGNAFIGHRKEVDIKGRLVENGRELGNFYGKRYSMGGAFANFKGSCSVLGRCLDALSGDIAQWLKNPVKDARLGD